MLEISRSERHFLLILLLLGLVFVGVSYHKKTASSRDIRTIDIVEKPFLIDINTATIAEIERLPGIGPVLASDIVAYREKIGGFSFPQELKNIKGIGDKKFEKIILHLRQ